MSQANVEIVRAQYDSFSRLAERDEVHSHVLGYFDPNCEYRLVEEIIDGGELVVAEVTTIGRGRTSGVEISGCFTSSSCATAGSFERASTWTGTRPSKPSGCRTRNFDRGFWGA